MHTVQNYKLNK